MNWVIIIGLIVLAFIFVKFKDLKHKSFIVFLIILFLFFYATGYRVLAGQDIDWKTTTGIEKGGKLYFSCL